MRRVLREFRQMEVEEQILSGGALLAVVSVFFPWFGGDWFGETVMWNGLQFYTSVVGFLVLLGHLVILSVTLLPLFGYTLIAPGRRDILRFIVGLECILLLVVTISIFAKIALESPRVETRFGVYMSLVSSIVVSLYSFLRIQQHRRREVEEFFSLGGNAEQKTVDQKELRPAPQEAPPRVVGAVRVPRERPRPAVTARPETPPTLQAVPTKTRDESPPVIGRREPTPLPTASLFADEKAGKPAVPARPTLFETDGHE